MRELTEARIRESFVNVPAAEVHRIPMPGLHEMVWSEREYLGWHDARSPQRAYLAMWRGDAPVSFVLRAGPGGRHGISAMCSLCHTPQPGSQVVLFTAPRTGDAGLRGDTIGTYICADLGCSAIIRMLPPAAPMQLAPSELVQRRIEGLRNRLDAFARELLEA